MARPRKEIDWDTFDKLCAFQCTEEEIAQWFDCTVDTITACLKRDKKSSFSEYYAQKRGKGRIALRRRQWHKALEANDTAMLIWLGKQYLGQKDKHEQSGDPDRPIKIIVEYEDDSKEVKDNEH